MKEKQLLHELEVALHANKNQSDSKAMAAYMKNRFPFFGIKKPLREQLTKSLLKELSKLEPDRYSFIVKHLWSKPEREFQYCCIDFLEWCIKKWDEDFIETLEWMIVNKS